MSIDPNSPEYLFGQVIQRLDTVTDQYKDILKRIQLIHDLAISNGSQMATLQLSTVSKKDCENCDTRMAVKVIEIDKAKLIGLCFGIGIGSGGITGAIIKLWGS